MNPLEFPLVIGDRSALSYISQAAYVLEHITSGLRPGEDQTLADAWDALLRVSPIIERLQDEAKARASTKEVRNV